MAKTKMGIMKKACRTCAGKGGIDARVRKGMHPGKAEQAVGQGLNKHVVHTSLPGFATGKGGPSYGMGGPVVDGLSKVARAVRGERMNVAPNAVKLGAPRSMPVRLPEVRLKDVMENRTIAPRDPSRLSISAKPYPENALPALTTAERNARVMREDEAMKRIRNEKLRQEERKMRNAEIELELKKRLQK